MVNLYTLKVWVLNPSQTHRKGCKAGTNCPGKWTSQQVCRYSEAWMWHLGTWLSSGLGNTRSTVGFNDIQGLFQSKQFNFSMIQASLLHTIIQKISPNQGRFYYTHLVI